MAQPFVRAGKLRHRVFVQSWIEARDDHGGVNETWADPGVERWASVQPITGREQWFAEQVEAGITHRVEMRYYDVNPKDRITYDGRIFQVVSVKNLDERRIRVEIMCQEVVNA